MTGASRGIGAAIAELAVARGFSVAVNFSTSEEEAQAVVEKIVSSDGRACAIQADVSREKVLFRS